MRFWLSLSCLKCGGQGRNRTADASLFRAALYQLSYLAILASQAVLASSASDRKTLQDEMEAVNTACNAGVSSFEL